MPIAYSYQRFSSPAQQHGVSLERQSDLAVRYAHAHGLILDDRSYRDLGVSAFRGKNAATGALGAFLTAVESGTVAKGSFLLIEDMDRLSREEPMEAFRLFQRIIDLGIVLVPLKEGFAYSKASLKAEPYRLHVVLGQMERAHDESVTKSNRAHDAIARRVQRGELRAPRLPSWLKRSPDRKSATIVPEIAAVVKQAFEWTLAGVGGREIARRFNDEDVKTFGRGELWTQAAVSQLLHSPAAYGAFVPITGNGAGRTRGEAQEGVYPAVVSKADWIRAQRMIDARALFKGGFGRNNPHNIFGGFSRCGHCGAVMRFLKSWTNKQKTKQNWYLRCAHTDLKRCEGQAFPFAASEAALVYEFAHRLDKHVGRDFFALQNSRREELEHEIETLKERQRKLSRGDLANIDVVVEQLKDLQAAIEKATAELSTLSTFATSKQEQHENAALFDIYMRLVDEGLADWNPHGDGVKEILELRRKFKSILARTMKRIEFRNTESGGWKPQLFITYVSDVRSTVDVTKFLPSRTLAKIANGTRRGKAQR